MNKTLIMKVTLDTETGHIKTETEGRGFDTLEILGLLESKKYDILNQMYNPEAFKRVRKDEDEEIIHKGD